MKNILIAVSLCLITITVGSAQIAATLTDFRAFTWSNSLEQVQNGEKADFVKQVKDDELVYKDKLGGTDCTLVYIFNDNDKLVSGIYFLDKKYSNPQLYLQDYNKFKVLLTEKYGRPTSEKVQSNNENETDEIHNYGQSVADGNLQLNAIWNTERTTIKITLISVGNQPDLQIHYTARSLDELENKADLKEAAKKL
jgi:hypothetical protein